MVAQQQQQQQEHLTPIALPPPGELAHAARKGVVPTLRAAFSSNGPLQPFRLVRQDARSLAGRYWSDWTVFNQLVVASAVYVFFTNLLPGITFAADLYEITGKNWGSIEIVLSTGLCGVVFSAYVVRLDTPSRFHRVVLRPSSDRHQVLPTSLSYG